MVTSDVIARAPERCPSGTKVERAVNNCPEVQDGRGLVDNSMLRCMLIQGPTRA